MGGRDIWKRLDERVLPPVGRVLARLARGARRLRFVRVAAVLISLSVVLVAVYAAGRTAPVTYAQPGPVVRLGVSDGRSIPRYVADAKTSLDQLIAAGASQAKPVPYYALVSMSAYLTPERLGQVLDGLPIQSTYVIMRVPSADQTEIIQLYAPYVPESVVQGMLATAARKKQEASDDRVLFSQVGDSSLTDRTLRAQYGQAEAVARLESRSYQSLCACVYGAVVRATPEVLGQLAHRSGVRAVQPAPAQFAPDSAVFQPPFPDQHTTAEPPPSSAPVPGT